MVSLPPPPSLQHSTCIYSRSIQQHTQAISLPQATLVVTAVNQILVYTHAYTHTHLHTHPHPHTHPCMNACTHTNTHTHRHVCKHIHAHNHTHATKRMHKLQNFPKPTLDCRTLHLKTIQNSLSQTILLGILGGR